MRENIDDSLMKHMTGAKIKVCKKGHKNSVNAIVCWQCGSEDLTVRHLGVYER